MRGTFIKVLVAYFAGAITMLVFLSPGKFKLEDLQNYTPRNIAQPEKRAELVDFNQAARRVEKAGFMADYYARQAKKYIQTAGE